MELEMSRVTIADCVSEVHPPNSEWDDWDLFSILEMQCEREDRTQRIREKWRMKDVSTSEQGCFEVCERSCVYSFMSMCCVSIGAVCLRCM